MLTLNEKLAPYESPNQETLGELFFGFLNYYANAFDFEMDAISVRLGQTISRSTIRQTQTGQHSSCADQWKYLCIEEPFNLSNTAYSVFDCSTFLQILKIIRTSYGVVLRTGNVGLITSHHL